MQICFIALSANALDSSINAVFLSLFTKCHLVDYIIAEYNIMSIVKLRIVSPLITLFLTKCHQIWTWIFLIGLIKN